MRNKKIGVILLFVALFLSVLIFANNQKYVKFADPIMEKEALSNLNKNKGARITKQEAQTLTTFRIYEPYLFNIETLEDLLSFPNLQTLGIGIVDYSEKALASGINIHEEPLTQEQYHHYISELKEVLPSMNKLKRLVILSNTKIRNLDFLEACDQIEELEIADNEIDNLTGISEAANIRQLNIKGNKIKDLAPLIELNHLDYLDIDENPVEDLAPLLEMKHLKGVAFDGTISDTNQEILSVLRERGCIVVENSAELWGIREGKLQYVWLLEKLAHFDRELLPERRMYV